jgi:hypothetical protein
MSLSGPQPLIQQDPKFQPAKEGRFPSALSRPRPCQPPRRPVWERLCRGAPAILRSSVARCRADDLDRNSREIQRPRLDVKAA